MPPILVDPNWFNRRWYDTPRLAPSRPPHLLGWIALAASVVLTFVTVSI
jgi:hypothetical protein